MKCDNCKQNDASIFYEETVNGVKKSMHLCPECAGKLQKEQFPFPNLSASSLLGDLFGFSSLGAPKEPSKACSGCGATWKDIRTEGKAFCPLCYTTFEKELQQTLRSLHGNVTHVGRAPAGRRAQRERRDRLSTLKAALAEAIRQENFEQAAILRDEIRALEH